MAAIITVSSGTAAVGRAFTFQRNRAFLIGDETGVSMPADGELFLGINDSNFNDNSGAFTVKIETL
jgi:hypothetical protein